MNFYAIAILGSDAVIILLNLIFNKYLFNLSIIYIIGAGLFGMVAVIAVDGITAWLIRRLPTKWFSYEVPFFEVSKKECKFYEKLGIKNWKDKVIELGMFTSFRKNHIADPKSVEYMERFILESNYGSVIHIVNIVCGFGIIFFYPLEYYACFGLPVAIVNAFLSFLPFTILRYNIPRLQIVRKRLARQQSTVAN